jgi:hypothetical protein
MPLCAIKNIRAKAPPTVLSALLFELASNTEVWILEDLIELFENIDDGNIPSHPKNNTVAFAGVVPN